MPKKVIELTEQDRHNLVCVHKELGTPIKACTQCGLEWPHTGEFFQLLRGKPIGRCRPCHRKIAREAKRKWLATPEGREASRETMRKIRSTPEGLAKVNKANVKSCIKRRKTDPEYAVKHEMRVTLIRMLGAKNDGHTISRYKQFIPYTASEYRSHIEHQFEPWMTWDNRGQGPGNWEVDHIVPVSWFQCVNPDGSYNEPAIVAAQSLENLRPLSYEENMKRKDTMTLEEYLNVPEWITAEVVFDRIKISTADAA